jgi:hypothetical protein
VTVTFGSFLGFLCFFNIDFRSTLARAINGKKLHQPAVKTDRLPVAREARPQARWACSRPEA